MLHGRSTPVRLTRVGRQRPTSWRALMAALLAALLLIAAPGALATAQTRIGINGGRPSEWPILAQVLATQGLTQESWLEFASHIGENWLPGTTPVALTYPGQLGVVSGPSALTVDQSTAVGQQLLHALILDELAKGEPVAVAGLSEGTLVIDRELAYLATLSAEDAPSRDALTFYVFGDMLRGLGQMYLQGVTIPFVGQTFGPVPETQYDTVVVNEQWDGWANPPDRPWNLLADLNAVMGALLTINGSNDHSLTSLDSLADAVKVSETTNKLGGTTTTYLVPRQQLPLTRPLRALGFPGWVVDEIDKLLMPFIRAGYSTLTPNLGPHVDRGQLVWTTPAPPTPEVTSAVETVDLASAATVPDAVDSSTLDAASSARMVSPRPDRSEEVTADVSEVVDEDREGVVADQAAPTVDPTDAESVADVVVSDRQPADAVTAAPDDSEAVVTHRIRPARTAGPDDSSDVDQPARQTTGSAEKPAGPKGPAGGGGDATPSNTADTAATGADAAA